jgi:hypothetical protein
MALISQAEFAYFLTRFASKYPYNQIFTTRRRFHVKWLITNKSTFGSRNGIPRDIGNHTAIPSNSLDDEMVQYMIIHKKAQPVPPTMSIILDWMYCWGRGKDVHWYSHVVDWLHFLIYHGIHLSDRIVLRDCVEYRIRKMIHTRGLDINTIIPMWHQYFDEQYEYTTKHFYDLACFSFHWFETTFPFSTPPAIVGPALVASSP